MVRLALIVAVQLIAELKAMELAVRLALVDDTAMALEASFTPIVSAAEIVATPKLVAATRIWVVRLVEVVDVT